APAGAGPFKIPDPDDDVVDPGYSIGHNSRFPILIPASIPVLRHFGRKGIDASGMTRGAPKPVPCFACFFRFRSGGSPPGHRVEFIGFTTKSVRNIVYQTCPIAVARIRYREYSVWV